MTYQFADLLKAFPTQHDKVSDNGKIGQKPDNSGKLQAALYQKGAWYRSMLSLVASHVARGLSDEEILLIAPSVTLPGYTVDQTRSELQSFISSARLKGFDHHSAFDGTEPATSVFDANFARVGSTVVKPKQKLFDHFMDVSLEPPSYLIEGILVEKTLAALVAPSYSGKTFIAVDMACSIAFEHSFHGHETVKGGVFCVIGESRSGWRSRIASWCKQRGIALEKPEASLFLSRFGLNFRDADTVEALKEELRTCNGVKLIIIDTLARSFGGGNENAAQDMGQFIQACDDIMHEFDVTVLIVHHMGKDAASGARGSSAFYAALDTELIAKKVGDDIQLICDKQKEGPEFETMQFCLVQSANDSEAPVLGLVPTSSKQANSRLGINAQLAMDAFAEATKSMPRPCRLHLENWRAIFNKRHTGDTAKQKSDAFRRARADLVSLGFLEVHDDYYSLGDKATNGDI